MKEKKVKFKRSDEEKFTKGVIRIFKDMIILKDKEKLNQLGFPLIREINFDGQRVNTLTIKTDPLSYYITKSSKEEVMKIYRTLKKSIFLFEQQRAFKEIRDKLEDIKEKEVMQGISLAIESFEDILREKKYALLYMKKIQG